MHWQWIVSYYIYAIGDVYCGVMPSDFLLETETEISKKHDVFVSEFLVYDAL